MGLHLKYKTNGQLRLQDIFNYKIFNEVKLLKEKEEGSLFEVGYSESLPESSTPLTTFQVKLTLDILNAKVGEYFIHWGTEWGTSSTGKPMTVKVDVIEDPFGVPVVTNYHNGSHRPSDAYPAYMLDSFFFKFNNNVIQDLRISLEYRADQNSMTAYIKETRLHAFIKLGL
jgi:hypothetical protein